MPLFGGEGTGGGGGGGGRARARRRGGGGGFGAGYRHMQYGLLQRMPVGICPTQGHAVPSVPTGATIFLYSLVLHLSWIHVNSSERGSAPGGRGDHGFLLYVKSICSQHFRSDDTSLAVVLNVPLRSIALRVGGLPTGTSVSHSL